MYFLFLGTFLQNFFWPLKSPYCLFAVEKPKAKGGGWGIEFGSLIYPIPSPPTGWTNWPINVVHISNLYWVLTTNLLLSIYPHIPYIHYLTTFWIVTCNKKYFFIIKIIFVWYWKWWRQIFIQILKITKLTLSFKAKFLRYK